jgi:pSer/pThr/pTyr-binding forkhead associated (FHA) protein
MTQRICPACNKNYGADYADDFCACGVELVKDWTATPPKRPATAATAPAVTTAEPQRPPAGTRCLVLYDEDKRPVQYFPLDRDATLIGREDAVEGVFPEIDLRQWLDEASARKVSRRHALILHSRANDSYAIRPLAGNSGTQIEADMVPAQEDVPLKPGTRIVLGGAVRFKFEIA